MAKQDCACSIIYYTMWAVQVRAQHDLFVSEKCNSTGMLSPCPASASGLPKAVPCVVNCMWKCMYKIPCYLS